ncbi:MAG: hypothetical protein GX235_08725 [Clostridiales bacterium]|nr:hypothetical protein [Clostridiales bacterium]
MTSQVLQKYPNLKKNIHWMVFAGLALVQYLWIVWFNLANTDRAIDSDSAKLFVHAIEIWNNKSLLLPNWQYTTTLEIDSAMLLALPIYGICKNIYIAFAVSNSILLAFSMYIVFRLLKNFQVQTEYRFLAINLILTPYAYGMLDYFNMLYLNGSQYIIKVFLPLFFVMLLFEKAYFHKIGLGILYIGLLFLSSFSSGIYIFVSCILPIICFIAYDILLQKSWERYDRWQYIVAAGSVLAALGGFFLNIFCKINAKGMDIRLVQSDNFITYLEVSLNGLFRLFDALPNTEIKVMSVNGIAYALKWLLVLLLIYIGIRYLYSMFKKTKTHQLYQYLMSIVMCNVVILTLCDARYAVTNTVMEYRYYLIGAVALLILLAYWISVQSIQWNNVFHTVVQLCLAGSILLVSMVSWKDATHALGEHDYCVELCQYFKQQNVDNIVFVNDDETTECCRLIDGSQKYSNYVSDWNGFSVADYYLEAARASYFGKSNLVMLHQGGKPSDYFGEDVSQKYIMIGTIKWFDVYRAEEFCLPVQE